MDVDVDQVADNLMEDTGLTAGKKRIKMLLHLLGVYSRILRRPKLLAVRSLIAVDGRTSGGDLLLFAKQCPSSLYIFW